MLSMRIAERVQALEQCLENADLDSAHDVRLQTYIGTNTLTLRKLGERANALYFRALVEEHDRGRYTDRLAETGTIALGSAFGDETAYQIERYVEQDLLVPEAVDSATSERRGQLSTGGGQCRWTSRLYAIQCIG